MDNNSIDNTNEEIERFKPNSEPLSTSKMISLICGVAVPALITNVLGYFCVVVNAVFAGRMSDPTKLAAVGITSVIMNLMILSLMIGLNSAQETLTSQAFGYGNIRLCGVYLNRGRFILIAFFIPVAILIGFFGQQLLLALGQDPEVSRLAHVQMLYGLPSVFFYGHFDLYKRWLAC